MNAEICEQRKVCSALFKKDVCDVRAQKTRNDFDTLLMAIYDKIVVLNFKLLDSLARKKKEIAKLDWISEVISLPRMKFEAIIAKVNMSLSPNSML